MSDNELDANVTVAIQNASKTLTAEFDLKLEVVHNDAHRRMNRMEEAAEKSSDAIGSKLDKIGADTTKILVALGKQNVKVEAHGKSIDDLYKSRFVIFMAFVAATLSLVAYLLKPAPPQIQPTPTQIAQPQPHVDGG